MQTPFNDRTKVIILRGPCRAPVIGPLFFFNRKNGFGSWNTHHVTRIYARSMRQWDQRSGSGPRSSAGHPSPKEGDLGDHIALRYKHFIAWILRDILASHEHTRPRWRVDWPALRCCATFWFNCFGSLPSSRLFGNVSLLPLFIIIWSGNLLALNSHLYSDMWEEWFWWTAPKPRGPLRGDVGLVILSCVWF